MLALQGAWLVVTQSLTELRLQALAYVYARDKHGRMEQLERLLQGLKDGRVSVGRKVQRLPASDEVDFLADLNDDCLRLELRW